MVGLVPTPPANAGFPNGSAIRVLKISFCSVLWCGVRVWCAASESVSMEGVSLMPDYVSLRSLWRGMKGLWRQGRGMVGLDFLFVRFV